MPQAVTQKLREFAEEVGRDVNSINRFLTKTAPPDADSLNGLTLNANISRYSGYLADDPDAAYKEGQGPGSTVNYITQSPTFNLVTPTPESAINKGDAGVIECWINGAMVDRFDLGAAYDPAHEEGNQPWTPAHGANGVLTILSVGVYNNIWQKVQARVNVQNLRKGYNSIGLRHTGINGDQVSQLFQVFLDSNTELPVITATNGAYINPDHINLKYLSGVPALGDGSRIKIQVAVDRLFNNTYHGTPLQIIGNGIATQNVAFNDPRVSIPHVPPQPGDILTFTDNERPLANNKCGNDFRVTAQPRSVFGWASSSQSTADGFRVDTLDGGDTNTRVVWNTESRRLPRLFDMLNSKSPQTGLWDSEAPLHKKDAQVAILADNLHGVRYPGGNYVGTLPKHPSGNPNYDLLDTTMVRILTWFVSPGARSSMVLTLEGVTGGIAPNGEGDINVFVILPTQTDFLDAGRPLDASVPPKGGPTTTPGALVGSIDYSGGKARMTVDFKGRSTVDTDNIVYVMVVFNNPNRVMTATEVTF